MEAFDYASAAFTLLANEARLSGCLTDAIRFEGIALICGELFAHLPARGILGAFEVLSEQTGPVGDRARKCVKVLQVRYESPAPDDHLPAVSAMFTLTARAFVLTLQKGEPVYTHLAQVMDDLLADATTLAMGQDFGNQSLASIHAHDFHTLEVVARLTTPTP